MTVKSVMDKFLVRTTSVGGSNFTSMLHVKPIDSTELSVRNCNLVYFVLIMTGLVMEVPDADSRNAVGESYTLRISYVF